MQLELNMINHNLNFISSDAVDYENAVSFMEHSISDIRHGIINETIWFLEHPPLYTAGTSANENDLIDKNRFPIYKTGRGGQYTYHGPNQQIIYIMLDIQTRKIGIREYIKLLEATIMDTLSSFNIHGVIREGRVGVWVCNDHQEAKIAAIGVRVRRGVTYHGIAININPDLSAFNGIIPCGIHEYGVTSFHKLGVYCTATQVQHAFQVAFINRLEKIRYET